MNEVVWYDPATGEYMVSDDDGSMEFRHLGVSGVAFANAMVRHGSCCRCRTEQAVMTVRSARLGHFLSPVCGDCAVEELCSGAEFVADIIDGMVTSGAAWITVRAWPDGVTWDRVAADFAYRCTLHEVAPVGTLTGAIDTYGLAVFEFTPALTPPQHTG